MVCPSHLIKSTLILGQAPTLEREETTPYLPGPTLLSERIQLGQGTTFLPGKKDPSIAYLIDHVLSHGYVIIPSIYTPSQVSFALSELKRLESLQKSKSGPASKGGRNPFEGFNTKRIYALPDKSRAFDCFPIHDTVTKLNDYFLQPACLITSYHTVVIEPGEREQEIHTDDGLVSLPRPRPLMGCVSSLSAFRFSAC